MGWPSGASTALLGRCWAHTVTPCPPPASPCFVPLSTHLEEAVALRRRALLHPSGDHFTLINIFNAFQQRECGQGLGVVPQTPLCPLLLLVSHTPSCVLCPGATFLTPSQCPAWLGEDLGVPALGWGLSPLLNSCVKGSQTGGAAVLPWSPA